MYYDERRGRKYFILVSFQVNRVSALVKTHCSLSIDNNFVFGTAEISNEGHEYTNNTLPTFLRDVFNSTESAFYNHKFPYTNFYVSKLDFWRKQNIQNNLQLISDNPQQIISRWGDLPIIGSILNFENINIEIIKGVEYSHLSHKSKFKITKKIKS